MGCSNSSPVICPRQPPLEFSKLPSYYVPSTKASSPSRIEKESQEPQLVTNLLKTMSQPSKLENGRPAPLKVSNMMFEKSSVQDSPELKFFTKRIEEPKSEMYMRNQMSLSLQKTRKKRVFSESLNFKMNTFKQKAISPQVFSPIRNESRGKNGTKGNEVLSNWKEPEGTYKFGLKQKTSERNSIIMPINILKKKEAQTPKLYKATSRQREPSLEDSQKVFPSEE